MEEIRKHILLAPEEAEDSDLLKVLFWDDWPPPDTAINSQHVNAFVAFTQTRAYQRAASLLEHRRAVRSILLEGQPEPPV